MANKKIHTKNGKSRMIDKVKQGKSNRAKGQRFELKCRKEMEAKGWNIMKCSNNVDLEENKFVQAKSNRFNMRSTGFPDFVAFRRTTCRPCKIKGFGGCGYTVIGVECKTNGKLDKIEKEKCNWLLENRIFDKILILKKGKKRGEIEYVEFV